MNTPNPKRPVMAKILALVAILTLAVGVFAIPCSANGWQNDVEAYYTPHPLTPYAVGYNGSVFRYHTNSLAFPRGSNTTFTDVDNFYVNGTQFGETTRLMINPQADNQRVTAVFDANYTISVNSYYSYATLHWGGFKYDRDTNARNYLPTIRLKYDFDTYGEHLLVAVDGLAIKYDDAGNRQEVDIIGQVPYTIAYEYSQPYAYYNVNLDTIFSYLTQRFDCTEYVNLTLTFLPKTAEGENNVDVTFFGYTMEYSVINEHTPLDTLNTTHTVYQQIINNGDASDFVSLATEWVSDLFTTPLFHFGYVPVTIGAILSIGTAVALTFWLLKLFLGG